MNHFNKVKKKEDVRERRRISVYIYDAQLKAIDEICKKRKKTRRLVFLEAIQSYIGAYLEGKV